MMRPLAILFFLSLLLLLLFTVAGDSECSSSDGDRNKYKARLLKMAAAFSILICGAVGVSLPTLSKCIPALSPENNIFFVIKAFAPGVTLATGFIHKLPDAFENLTSPCLSENPWGKFPFAGFGTMLGALGTLMVHTLATSYFNRLARAVNDETNIQDAEMTRPGGDPVVHVHATHGHAHRPDIDGSDKLVRHRVISQAKFKTISMETMILFFNITTPVYNGNSPIALIFEGVLNSVSVGILIYMALVEGVLNSVSARILIYMALIDLLAEDFMNLKVQNKGKLQVGIIVSLLIGASLMSLLAKWA